MSGFALVTISSRRLFPLVLTLSLAGQGLAESLLFERAALAQSGSQVSLRLRKETKHLDVVLAGIGDSARVVQEQSTNATWRGEIRPSKQSSPTEMVSQQVAMPEMGLASVRLRGSGSTYQLEVESVSGTVLQKPKILATGDDLVLRFRGLADVGVARQTGSFDLRRPARIPQRVSAPPLRSRAVAPPLGDMAVGSMLISNRSFVQVSGPPVTLTLNNAPPKDALMALARLGDYGFVFIGAPAGDASGESGVTMSFRGESYARALNSVLMASGLQGKLDGRTLLVGTSVSSKTFGPQMSKVFRLNQVDASSALNYLGSLGAKVNVANTKTVTATSSEDDESEDGTEGSGGSTSSTSESTIVESYGAEVGPLVGLVGTADARLNSLVLVGHPKLIGVAEAYLRQIDLRKRQVAVKVQILNVRLENNAAIDSSFSAKMGNTFIVSQSGTAHMNFGQYKPGRAQEGTGLYDGNEYATPGSYPSFVPRVQAQDMQDPYVESQEVLDPYIITKEPGAAVADGEEEYTEKLDDLGRPEYALDSNPNASKQLRPRLDSQGRPIYVPDTNPNATQTAVPRFDKKGRPIYVDASDPNKFTYPNNSFYSYVESVIESANTKTIAQPTLLVQEGEKAVVRSGLSVITGVNKSESSSGSVSFTNTRENAGLTVDLEVEKIDDNGFVTLKLDPTVAVPVPAGRQEGILISDINRRELKSGRIRLRDRQTLVLTGVIQEDDREAARKWPLLGDLPLIGQLFRSSSSSSLKNELVIIVTPSILDDDNGGTYGYGYRPGTKEATRLIGSGSYP